MTKQVDVAVVGATGAVGEAMLEILHQRKFPVGKVYALASERSAGSTVQFGNKSLIVEDLAECDFSKVQVGLFSPGASVSEIYAPKAAAAGCVVIDNTSQFRYDDDVPLVLCDARDRESVKEVLVGVVQHAMTQAAGRRSAVTT